MDPVTGELQKYMIQSLPSIRYGINHTLKEHEYQFDIIISDQFIKKHRKAFDDASKELKQEGYGHVNHAPDIEPNGKKNLYFVIFR